MQKTRVATIRLHGLRVCISSATKEKTQKHKTKRKQNKNSNDISRQNKQEVNANGIVDMQQLIRECKVGLVIGSLNEKILNQTLSTKPTS